MKFLCGLAAILAANVEPLEFKNPFAEMLARATARNETDIDIFILSEAFSFDELKEMLRNSSLDEASDKRRIQPLANEQSVLSDQDRLKLLYDFSEQYSKTVSELKYDSSAAPEWLSENLVNVLGARASELEGKVIGQMVPKIELITSHDAEMIKLVYKMRHELFPSHVVTMKSEKFINLLLYYEKANFNENQLANIFMKSYAKGSKHLRIKCDMVFAINLYYLLAKEKLIVEFKELLYGVPKKFVSAFGCHKQNAFADTFDSDLAPLKRLKFIKSLFRVVEVNYSVQLKTYSLNFTRVLRNMQYALYGRDGDVDIIIHTGNRCPASLNFIDMINEENQIVKKIIRLCAKVPYKRKARLDAIYCAFLCLFPQILEFSLVNNPYSRYNSHYKDNCTYFDHLVYTLLINHRETLTTLYGFEVAGFNKLSGRAVSLLRQHKFEKLGLRGIFSKADKSYLFQILNETPSTAGTTSEEIREILKLEEDSFSIPVDEFNNLRNSVTTFIGTEETVKLVLDNHFIPNIERANAFFYLKNNNYDLYSSEERVLKKLEELKKSSDNKAPLHLSRLTVIPQNFPNEWQYSTTRKQKGKEGALFLHETSGLTNSNAYTVSRLVVHTHVNHTRDAKAMESIHLLAVADDTLEITVTKDDVENIDRFSKYLASLHFKGKKIELCLDIECFMHLHEGSRKIKRDVLDMIIAIYQDHIQPFNGKRLTAHFSSEKIPADFSTEDLEYLIFDHYVTKKNLMREEQSAELTMLRDKIAAAISWHYNIREMETTPHDIKCYIMSDALTLS
ncbi:hypothetical protein ENBRE01_0130 [Enteropsectra breve]|nr:hypothetical protein ENBRE01_0130 [Enteropsectra breve]